MDKLDMSKEYTGQVVDKNTFDKFNREFIRNMENRMFEQLVGPTSQTVDFDPVEEINRTIDSLTTLIICNPDDYFYLKEFLDKQKGYYELIKDSNLEKGKVMLVEDENLKMEALKKKRKLKKEWKKLCKEYEKIGIKLNTEY